MCTVSWLQDGDGYELFCNRDERHTRKPARAPKLQERNGVRFVAPMDGDHGGSWIGVNEFGLALCLLNRYEKAPVSEGLQFVSRGLLLTGLIDSRDAQQFSERVVAEDLSCYRPFTLLAMTPRDPPVVLQWDGSAQFLVYSGDVSIPLTSSSFRPTEVVASRRQSLRRMTEKTGEITAELLGKFHRSHDPSRGPYSVCMHRDDAATVSFSQISVSEQAIRFFYVGHSPCTREVAEVPHSTDLRRLKMDPRVAAQSDASCVA